MTEQDVAAITAFWDDSDQEGRPRDDRAARARCGISRQRDLSSVKIATSFS